MRAAGMADGDIVVWRGVESVKRIRLAHPGGVFDIHADMTRMLSGGKDCVLCVWNINSVAPCVCCRMLPYAAVC
jgi:hypothetical protein